MIQGRIPRGHWLLAALLCLCCVAMPLQAASPDERLWEAIRDGDQAGVEAALAAGLHPSGFSFAESLTSFRPSSPEDRPGT